MIGQHGMIKNVKSEYNGAMGRIVNVDGDKVSIYISDFDKVVTEDEKNIFFLNRGAVSV
jgi:transcription elongation factor